MRDDRQPREHAPRFRFFPGGFLYLAAVGACVPPLIGFLGRAWWRFELLCHFRAQYFLGLAVVSLLLVIRKHFKAASITGVVALINLALILPLYFGPSQPTGNGQPLRLLSMNVLTQNQEHDRVREFIRETDADFVLLQEVNSTWMEALEPLTSLYPYQKYQPREDNFGIALLSKLPFKEIRIEQSAETDGVPFIIAGLESNGRPFTLVGVHTIPPINRECASMRDDFLNHLAMLAAGYETPLLLAGDFNATSWSPDFRHLVRTSGLRDSRKGFGVQATWPSDIILLRIPLDHCLVSEDVVIVNREVGPDIGSDHFPIVVDFVVGADASQ